MKSTWVGSMALALAFATATAHAQKAPRLLALNIGINEYADPKVTALEGAINDAKAMQSLAHDLKAVLNLNLVGSAATKQAVEAAWQQVVEQSQPGDVILLSFAGHGTREKLAQPDDSDPDGFEEYSVFYGKGELMSGDEWNAKFAQVKDRTVVFLNDSCHAAGQTRSAASSRTRNTDSSVFSFADMGEVKPVAMQAHVVSLAAVEETQTVPEISYNGQQRGAMTVAFEYALRGGADRAGDGLVTGQELNESVLSKVETLSGSPQKPALTLNDGATRSLFRSLPAAKAEDADKMRVAVELPQAEFAQFNKGAVARAGADFLWNQQQGTLYRTKEGWGHPLMFQVRAVKQVELEVRRWRLIEALKAAALPIQVNVSSATRPQRPLMLADQDQGYWSLGNVQGNKVTVINVSTGGSYFVFPSNMTSDRFRVEDTFGVDHLLAIEWLTTPDPHFVHLKGVGMRDMDETQMRALEALAKRKDVRLGLALVYTCPSIVAGKCQDKP